jgi:hypothetical protein
MSAAAAPEIDLDAKTFAWVGKRPETQEQNRLKGFLGTADEMTDVAQIVAPHSVEWVRSLSDSELLPLGERALSDIADDILILDEIRQRFLRAKGQHVGRYTSWKDFVTQNSRYTLRTIQNRLAQKNGKDASKTNHQTGNRHTRQPALDEPVIPKGLEQNNPDVAERMRKGTLKIKPTKKATGRNHFAERDYFYRIGKGLATAFSGVDSRLSELAAIRQSEWTPEAEDGIKCLLLNLKECRQEIDAYTEKLKTTLKKRSR